MAITLPFPLYWNLLFFILIFVLVRATTGNRFLPLGKGCCLPLDFFLVGRLRETVRFFRLFFLCELICNMRIENVYIPFLMFSKLIIIGCVVILMIIITALLFRGTSTVNKCLYTYCANCEKCDTNTGKCIPIDCGKCGTCDTQSGKCIEEICPPCQECDPMIGGCRNKECGACGSCDPSTGECACSSCQECDPSSGQCKDKDCGTCGSCNILTGQCEPKSCPTCTTCDSSTGDCTPVVCPSCSKCNNSTGECNPIICSTCHSCSTSSGNCEPTICPAGQKCDPIQNACIVPTTCPDMSCASYQYCETMTGDCLPNCSNLDGTVWSIPSLQQQITFKIAGNCVYNLQVDPNTRLGTVSLTSSGITLNISGVKCSLVSSTDISLNWKYESTGLTFTRVS